MTATKSQGSETLLTGGRKLYVVQESNTGRKTDCSKSNMSRYFVTARRQIKAFNWPLNEFYCFKLPSSRMS